MHKSVHNFIYNHEELKAIQHGKNQVTVVYVLIVCSYDGHSMILRVLFDIRNVYGMLRKALKCVV